MNVSAMTQRVIVFRATQMLMEQLARCPTPVEVYEEIEADVSYGKSAVGKILRSLNGADGLQYPTRLKGRLNTIRENENVYDATAVARRDEASCPVDRLMRGE